MEQINCNRRCTISDRFWRVFLRSDFQFGVADWPAMSDEPGRRVRPRLEKSQCRPNPRKQIQRRRGIRSLRRRRKAFSSLSGGTRHQGGKVSRAANPKPNLFQYCRKSAEAYMYFIISLIPSGLLGLVRGRFCARLGLWLPSPADQPDNQPN